MASGVGGGTTIDYLIHMTKWIVGKEKRIKDMDGQDRPGKRTSGNLKNILCHYDGAFGEQDALPCWLLACRIVKKPIPTEHMTVK